MNKEKKDKLKAIKRSSRKGRKNALLEKDILESLFQ